VSEKTRAVLDVGNCDPDHSAIRRMLEQHFDVRIERVMFVDEALEAMRRERFDLVLFNRLIFEDGSEGIELLRRAKADPILRDTPIMMVSNLAEAQAASVAAGGVEGFGKASLDAPRTRALLGPYLAVQ
jgi:CheY-like chemotaxis protein